MNINTIARLFNIACSRLVGNDGQSAVYHLGRAMALYHLSDKQDPCGNYYEYMREVGEAKKIFRTARRMRNIRDLPPVRSSGGCRSSECEGAYLRVA